MSDAAVRVDPDFYNRRLLGADASVQQNSQGGYSAAGGGGNSMRTAGLSGDSGGIMGQGGGGGGYSAPDLPDYLVRQHSLLGFYLSLSPRDEADAERNWGFPQPQRAAIAGVTVVVPLLMALFITGSWLWKWCVIGAVTVFARLATSFALTLFADVDFPVLGYTLAVWPHLTVGALGLVSLIWFVIAAASGTGWSTMWLCFTTLLFLAFVEAALRGGMWHFKWWAPAERFSFLKPWGDYRAVSSDGQGSSRPSTYAPPRPTSARPEEPLGGNGGFGGGGGAVNGGGLSTDKTALSEEIGKALGDTDDFMQESV